MFLLLISILRILNTCEIIEDFEMLNVFRFQICDFESKIQTYDDTLKEKSEEIEILEFRLFESQDKTVCIPLIMKRLWNIINK